MDLLKARDIFEQRNDAEGKRDKQPDRKDHAEDDADINGDVHHALIALFSEPHLELTRLARVLAVEFGGTGQYAGPDDHHNEKVQEATKHRNFLPPLLLLLDPRGLELDPAVLGAHCGGDAFLAAHHHALQNGLTADFRYKLPHNLPVSTAFAVNSAK